MKNTESRFERFKLIKWWNQKKLIDAKILVIGAGAIGNEVLKNLALLGIGNIFIIDMDVIENSNLSRSVLFREKDEGNYKAEASAKMLEQIYPDINVNFYVGNVTNDIGMGIFNWADIIICCVDNREARVTINKNCWRLNKPWIDGATEYINGVVKVFAPPEGACYECTMSKTDWELINQRKGCAGLSRDQISEGKTPTTPTTSSIVAAFQVQECLKYLHRMETLESRGFYINGLTNMTYIIEYPRSSNCLCHFQYTNILNTEKKSNEMTIQELFDKSKIMLGPSTVLEFPYDIVSEFNCLKCKSSTIVYKKLISLKESDAICKICSNEMQVDIFNKYEGTELFGDKTFSEIDIPLYDIISARSFDKQIFWEFNADKEIFFNQNILK